MWQLSEQVETGLGRVAAGRSGAGPALVLAHGWPWSSYGWHRVIPALARRHTVFWYDMPGYGQSAPCLDRSTGLGAQGEVFARMLDHWGLERPLVLAHDMGGAVTLRAHLLHGCDFAACGLMNVVAMRPWGSAFFDHVARHTAAFQGLPAHIHRAIVEAYIRGALVSPIEEVDVDALVAPWLEGDGAVSFFKQFAEADERFTAEVEPMFGQVRCPVRVIWGEDDPWIPLDRGKALAAAIGQGPLVPLPGVGHLPQLEAPGAVLRALEGVF